MREERVKALASRIRRDPAFSDELAANVGNMAKADREVVIAAVVHSGLCDSKIVRAIRSDFGAFKMEAEGALCLDEFERRYDRVKKD